MKKNPEVAKLPGSDFPEGSYLKGLGVREERKKLRKSRRLPKFGLNTLAFLIPRHV
jgi:hypothetical protein